MPTASLSEMPQTLHERFESVKDRIAGAARRAGRRADDVLLVAVTKHAEQDQIRALIDLGHRDFGENRVQNLVQEAAMVEEYVSRLRVAPTPKGSPALDTSRPSSPVRWHMIGHLQRNKARKVIEFVRLVHSVDSLRLAEELQQIALRRENIIDVLVQVNCSGERGKFGCPVPAALPLAEQIDTMINVRVRGLMTLAPYSENPEDARATFARCRELYEELRTSGISQGNVNVLSMGMTGDFEVAISEGANVVRVGTAIFGEPKNPGPDQDADSE
jgi:pyridoxal phosphate enzyme (YggS family)